MLNNKLIFYILPPSKPGFGFGIYRKAVLAICQGENCSKTTGSNWRAIFHLGGEYKEVRSLLLN